MDKAEIVFEKLAGAKWEAVKSFTKGIFGIGKSERAKTMDYLRKSVKGESFQGTRNISTPRIDKLNKKYNYDTFRQMDTSKEMVTRGKLPVAPPDREKLLKDLAAERHKRMYGIA